MATVELRQVRKTYDQHQVIHGLDLLIADGEFIVIVGPSGCGKSTLLRMVAGLEPISEGEILIGDKVVNRLEPMDRDIAMVFQNYALYPHMSVFDNMAYGLKMRAMAKDEIRRRVERAAAILELGELLQRRPRQLSGGQRQRVAMGRAIVREPAAFLFDEPLSNLDAKLRVQMRLEIQTLHRELKTTSLYVTHDQVEAMTLAQRMVVMNAGRAEQIGTPREVYDRPASTFVAAFIGSPPMNLIDGIVGTAGTDFVLGDSQIALPEARPDLAGRKLTLGLRPEHLQPGGSELTMKLRLIEELGGENLIHGTVAGKPLVVRCATQVTKGWENANTMPIGFGRNVMHWFDPDTGLRLS